MAGGGSKLSLHVERAVEGDRFFTWRGHVRQFFPQEGRLVLNAHVGDELAGSAIVSAHEADVDEQRESAWTLADARFSPSGPYFGDPDLFAEPFYLHFESLFTRHDLRRAGVAAALIDGVRAIGLPTFAEFREPWLADVFGRWEVTDDSQDDAWRWTQEGLGGSLGIALTLALDGEFFEEARFDAGVFRIRFRAHAGGERIVARDADYRDRSDDEGGDRDDEISLEEEGLIEDDRVRLAPDAWEEDDLEWLPQELDEQLRFHLREDRSGVSLTDIKIDAVAAPLPGSREEAQYDVSITGRVDEPSLLLARAQWRRYLRAYEPDWTPTTIGEAVREAARLASFHVTRWKTGYR